MRPQSNLEQCFDMVGNDVGFGLSKHGEDDDGTSTLEFGNRLVGACGVELESGSRLADGRQTLHVLYTCQSLAMTSSSTTP